MSRSIIAGMTDYSHQTFEDMVHDIQDWVSDLNTTINYYNETIANLKSTNFRNDAPYDLKRLFEYALHFYATSKSELSEILHEITLEVKRHHVERIKNLSDTSKQLNQKYGITWHSADIDYSDVNHQTLEKMYQRGRDTAAGMMDLSNLGARLAHFIGRVGEITISDIRIYIEMIDSFNKVKDVSITEVQGMLESGYLDINEETIQKGIENILYEPLHKKDWGGEINDLYTTNIVINGTRIATAFLLKGNGLRKKLMEIADCGKNGDQILRLFHSPAQLFVIQFVGNISEAVIKDAENKAELLRRQGKKAWVCVINGQDTARLMKAYEAP